MNYDNTNTATLYPPSYVVYEDGKLVKVLCQRCGEPIREIASGELTTRSGKKFHSQELIDLSNLCRGESIPIITAGVRSNFQPMLCTDCQGQDLDKQRIIEQLMDGWKQEKIAEGLTEEEAEIWISEHGYTEVVKEGDK